MVSGSCFIILVDFFFSSASCLLFGHLTVFFLAKRHKLLRFEFKVKEQNLRDSLIAIYSVSDVFLRRVVHFSFCFKTCILCLFDDHSSFTRRNSSKEIIYKKWLPFLSSTKENTNSQSKQINPKSSQKHQTPTTNQNHS